MDKQLLQSLIDTSSLSGGNIAYIEELYDAYLKQDPNLSETWRTYFKDLESQAKPNGQGADVPMSDIRATFIEMAKNNNRTTVAAAGPQAENGRYGKLANLIQAYRAYGHRHAKLDPLGLVVRTPVQNLQLGYHGFEPSDLSTHFKISTFPKLANPTLNEVHQALLRTYSDTLGVEYMHISDTEQTTWIQQKLESVQSHPSFDQEQKKRILLNLTRAEGLEKYLSAKYVGQTRFSLEGGSSLVAIMDELVQRAGTNGVKEMIIGMGHRGRLSILVNILACPFEVLCQEFEGKAIKPGYSGDVKYHLGLASDIPTAGGSIHVALTFNPSHLEIIDPVVEGSVKARQDSRADLQHDKVLPVLIHGDAAFAGQGVVMETFALSQTRSYGTGGTVHIIVNNQIGFTTSNPHDARSSEYCTDIAKMIDAPIFHVNGDDPEACVFAMQVAFDFRMRFKKDVIIDLVCYRRLGHNEADEPMATQPVMYRLIRQHERTPDIYAKKLQAEGVITQAEYDAMNTAYRDALDNNKTIITTIPKGSTGEVFPNWNPYKNQRWNQAVKTAISKKTLTTVGSSITTLPEGFVLQAQVAKEYENRRSMVEGKTPFNWGFAEAMAYATLLAEGHPVRLSGQDCGRGTFSHRHAVLHDQNSDSIYVPMQHIVDNQAAFTVIDSVLSEAAVMGFEYGYATTDPETMVIWEAQYGDFANNAQVVIDQFITSGEQKWTRLCGLSLFLPHGYEGAGPEHSSARLERFLQLSAQENIQVCMPTTPAQVFHMIRRQMLRMYRKPLIVFTPKSMLRNKLAVSEIADFTDGKFYPVITEIDALKPSEVNQVVLCSGKVYYDLLQKRRDEKLANVAIIRIEQLYPFPKEELIAELAKYPKASRVVWCQEEPENQGAWYSIYHWLLGCLAKGQQLTYVGRPASASPSTGYSAIHVKEQTKLVNDALLEGKS